MQALRESYPPLFRRHARRPRLTRLLDESTAQTILITAPAGYGKTTLATEWVQGRDDVVWYRATSGSADVAAFSAGLSDVIAPLVPNVGDRLKQRLRVADTPERAARPLAEILSEDLEAWPSGALLIVDDYHLVVDSAPVEEFMDWLLMLTPRLHVLVTTRRRPKWASARRILYGEITEIDAGQLAMTTEEAALVLDGRSTEEVRALVQQAEGWPALIGLAALSATHEIPAERVSEALYRYFAEEVVRGVSAEMEEVMLLASVPSALDRTRSHLFGGQKLETALPRLVQEGLLHPVGERFRFHPLLRSFLQRVLEAREPDRFKELTDRAIRLARQNEDWEEAFDLAIEAKRPEQALGVLWEATPNLLASGQTELLERWLKQCGAHAIDDPRAMITRSEVLIRQGHLSQALSIARNLARRSGVDGPQASRAWYLSGLALHLMSKEQEALDAHLEARRLAANDQDQSDALWGAYMAASELGLPDAGTYLDEMEAQQLSSPASLLRVATGRMAFPSQTLRNLTDVFEPLIDLAEHASDPMVETSFLSRVAETQAARAHYDEALNFAGRALAISEELHLDFAIPYCLIPRITAEIGLRDFSAARDSLANLTQMALSRDDPFLEVARHVLQLKLKISHRRHQYGEPDIAGDAWTRAQLAVRAEYLSLRALTAAVRGEAGPANELAEEASALSPGIDSSFNVRFSRLLSRCVAQGGDNLLAQETIDLVLECADAEAFEAIVLAARASEVWLPSIAGDTSAASIVKRTLIRSHDQSIARRAGLGIHDIERVEALLTRREREVFQLLAQGLSNSAIASQLFISESTVKVHVRHILKKLNVENRLQAVLRAAGMQDSASA